MSHFDPSWEVAHASRAWGQYPREDLIRFVARNYYAAPDRGAVRFLDLGCGAGAATWYLAREGFSVTAMDGSLSAMNRLAERLAFNEAARCTLMLQDLTLLQRASFREDAFDCVLDICTTQHLDDTHQENLITNAHRWLKPGGCIFSVLAAQGSNLTGYFHTSAAQISLTSNQGAFDLFAGFHDVRVDSVERVTAMGAWKEWIVTGRKP